MTLSSIAALFGTMVVLAMIPGPSVFAVVARSLSSGFAQGLVTVLGIVVGDFLFILLAIYGLSTIADALGSLFAIVKYLGGAYLIWLGIKLWRSRSASLSEITEVAESSWFANFLTGLFITLADQKAIFFYMSFFPAFLDLSQVTILDVGIVLLLAAIAIGGSKLTYAYLANKARYLFKSSRANKIMNITASIVMIGTGIYLITKS